MKYILLVALLVLVIGCKSSPDAEATIPKETPKVMPGGVGITAGQTGTGTTSGASTGY